MLKIAMIEDEELYARELEAILKDCLTQPEILWYASGELFLRQNSAEFAGIFIDIELPGINGLAVARQLRENGYAGMIVFTTNYEQFVFDGYEVEAFRYLVKPLSKETVLPCAQRMERDAQAKALQFSFDRKMHSIPYRELLYISSYGHYLTLHTKKQDFDWKFSLKELTPMLPEQFVRCHRSFVVNLDAIRKLDGKRLVLKNNEQIDVSDGYLQNVRNALSGMV